MMLSCSRALTTRCLPFTYPLLTSYLDGGYRQDTSCQLPDAGYINCRHQVSRRRVTCRNIVNTSSQLIILSSFNRDKTLAGILAALQYTNLQDYAGCLS